MNFINKIQNKSAAEINELMDKYYPNIKSTSIPKRFHYIVQDIFSTKMSDQKGLELLPKIYLIYEKLYPKLNTRKQALSNIRTKFIKKYQSNNLYKKSQLDKYFNLNFDQRVGIINEYKADIEKKNKNKLQININTILEKMRTLIQSSNPYDRAISLLLAYGGRPIELFIRNKFEKIPNKPSWLKILNLAKKREGQETSTTRPIVLFTPSEFLREVKRLRADFKGKVLENSKGELSKDKSQTLNKHALKHFPFLKTVHQKSSLFRKIYADTSWSLYGDPSIENQNSFISSALGHDGLMTSFSYSWVNVSDPDAIDNKKEINNKIDQLEAQIRLLMNVRDQDISDATSSNNLEELYQANPKITNAEMRKKSGKGSRAVNNFLREKRTKS